MDSALKPLWQAYDRLAEARDRRAPLDLDLPERRIRLDAQGRVERVYSPERLAAHRLIEEFMIQANVAAAEALEARRSPVVYRVHGAPSRDLGNQSTGPPEEVSATSVAPPRTGRVG